MAGSLEGKVALVTGGSSGIGRASAITFAREGARVIVADLDVSGGKDTLMIIKVSGGEATFIETDVSKAIEVEALINRSIEIYGRLDCAHNNAGIFGPASRIHSYPEEEWDHVINVNLKGVWLCMKYEILHMRHQGSGSYR